MSFRWKIKRGDCLKELKRFKDESVDAVITDPPYNIDKAEWDSYTLDQFYDLINKFSIESFRILKPGGNIIIFCIHRYVWVIQTILQSIGFKYRRMIIWHHENSMSRQIKTPVAEYDPILWYSKGDEYTYNIVRVPYKSVQRIKTPVFKDGKPWMPNPEGKKQGDVWNIPTLSGKRFSKEKLPHPSQKPLALMDRLIKSFTNEGDIVLDPFAGSGSTLVSAVNLNRKAIGIEKNKKYYNLMKQRLKSIRTRKIQT